MSEQGVSAIVTMPDGRRARVSGPDRGAVQQQIQQMLGQQQTSGRQPVEPQSLEEVILGSRPKNWDAEDGAVGPIDRRGMTNLRARFDIGGADNNAERIKALQKHYPGGTMDQIPGTGTWVYKEKRDDPDEQWKTVGREAKDFFNFSPKNPLAGASGLIGEVWGPIIGESAALLGSRGAGFLAKTLRVGAGGATGEAVRQGTQEMRGIGDQPLASQAADATMAGAFGAAGFVVSEPLVRLANIVSGRGSFQERPGAREMMDLIDKANTTLPDGAKIPQLSPGQVLDDAFFKRFEDQVLAITGSVIREQRRQQVTGMRGLIKGQVDFDAIDKAPDAVAAALQVADKRIRGMIANPKMTPQQGGNVLADSVKQYRNDSQQAVRSAYAEAESLGSPQFDMAPALARAEELTQPLQYMRRLGDEDRALMTAVGMDPDNPANRSFIAQRRASPEVAAVAKQIQEADPASLTLDNLMAWREELAELAFPGPDQTMRRPNAAAADLYRTLSEVMESPTNLGGTFGSAWLRANGLASRRFKTLESAAIGNLLRSDDQLSMQTVAQLTDFLVQPNQADNLVLMTGLGAPGRRAHRAIQEVFETRLFNMQDAASMRNELNRFDPETLNLLMPQAQRRKFSDMITQMEGLESTNVQRSLREQSRAVPLLNDILENRSTRGIDYLHDMVRENGGISGEFGNSLRHGLKDRVIQSFLSTEGDKAVRVGALNQEMRRLRDHGLDRFLTTADKQAINDIKQMGEFFDLIATSADAGTSLRAMEITSAMYDFTNPGRMAKGYWERFKAGTLSRWIMSPQARRMLVGRKDYKDFDWVRLGTIGAAEMARESNEAARNSSEN